MNAEKHLEEAKQLYQKAFEGAKGKSDSTVLGDASVVVRSLT